MSIIKYKTGEVRLTWRLSLILLLTVAVAVLLRFIPISIYTAILASGGMAETDALASAKSTVFENPVWSTGLGILNGMMSLLLVWFMIKVIEKQRFIWKSVGLDWRRNSLVLLASGALLAMMFYGADRVVGHAFGSSIPSMDMILAGLSIPVVLQKFVLYLAMGFGEEVVFRGYLQTRLVERFGALWGILIASITFTLLHLGFMSISLITIISGVLLWVTIGALYHWSQSLYLVGMFHGVANTLLNTINLESTEISGMLVNAIAFLLVVIFALRRARSARLSSNSA